MLKNKKILFFIFIVILIVLYNFFNTNNDIKEKNININKNYQFITFSPKNTSLLFKPNFNNVDELYDSKEIINGNVIKYFYNKNKKLLCVNIIEYDNEYDYSNGIEYYYVIDLNEKGKIILKNKDENKFKTENNITEDWIYY